MPANRRIARLSIESMKRELREITRIVGQLRERMGYALNNEEDMTLDDWKELQVWAREFEISADCICRFTRWVGVSRAI